MFNDSYTKLIVRVELEKYRRTSQFYFKRLLKSPKKLNPEMESI